MYIKQLSGKILRVWNAEKCKPSLQYMKTQQVSLKVRQIKHSNEYNLRAPSRLTLNQQSP